ncbi:uncharacterized protein NEMAJ01_1272 [Nematocida major]|uniref:uncharacterized protein n=1 Tax=Nematocida major TaxID=1912982 RepID=UPI002007E803|nr:uncharacterized protein NEMAJ01_1272 [Nematocida major]KAH9386376.1 hypothetical protein NEMAJ01_1272 [Nematocida major]
MWNASERQSAKEHSPGAYRGKKDEKNKGVYIPEASMYDEQPSFAPLRDPVVSQKAVTVFGYSSANLEHILRKFKGIGPIKEIHYGKNWMDIRYEAEKYMFLALQESGRIINGEMIGVFQKSRRNVPTARVENPNALLRKDTGLIERVLSYFFG